VSVGQFIPKFLAHRRVVRSEETAIREERRARPILKVFGDRRLTQVTTGEIHEYVERRKTKDGLRNRSINLELTLLRSIFRHAIECGFAAENPAKAVTNLTEQRDEKWIPSEDEIVRFVEEAKKTASAVVLVPWIWFRAYTGTRPKESVFVEWRDIDFKNDRISIRPKNGNQLKKSTVRHVEIHPGLKPILLEWKAKWDEVFAKRHERHPEEKSPPHDWVFFNPHDQVERAISFTKCFYEARRKARLPKMTSHTLRHYFISQAVMSKDVSFYTIAKWVGHRGTRMIEEVYGHLRKDYRQEQMGKVRIVGASEEANKPTAQPALRLLA
jgi:integrase